MKELIISVYQNQNDLDRLTDGLDPLDMLLAEEHAAHESDGTLEEYMEIGFRKKVNLKCDK